MEFANQKTGWESAEKEAKEQKGKPRQLIKK